MKRTNIRGGGGGGNYYRHPIISSSFNFEIQNW